MARFLNAYVPLIESGSVNRLNVVFLGAGFDTTFYWVQEGIENGELSSVLKGRITVVEVDFPSVVAKKISVIRSNEKMLEYLRDK